MLEIGKAKVNGRKVKKNRYAPHTNELKFLLSGKEVHRNQFVMIIRNIFVTLDKFFTYKITNSFTPAFTYMAYHF